MGVVRCKNIIFSIVVLLIINVISISALFAFYDPQAGRWLNRDPMGEKGGQNLYAFASNNSINFIDPLGLWVHPDGVTSPNDAVSTITDAEKEMSSVYNYAIDKSNISAGDINKDFSRKLLSELRKIYDTKFIKGEKNKWVFTCRYGWIDLGHFFTTAWLSTYVGANTSYDLSVKMETILQKGVLVVKENDPNAQSSGTAEDLNSNYQGAHFQHGGFGNIASNFKNLLKEAGAVKHGVINNINAKQILREDAASLLTGDDLETYTGERLYTKEKQLKYQREQLKAFCLLCEGDKAKEGFGY